MSRFPWLFPALLGGLLAFSQEASARRAIPLMPPKLSSYPEAPEIDHEDFELRERARINVFESPAPATTVARQQRGRARRAVFVPPPSRKAAYTRLRTRGQTSRRTPLNGGFEVGMIGRRHSTDSDLLGVQMMYGGRFFVIFPVANRIFLKPSLGFFLRGEGAGAASVTQFLGEAGLTVQYLFARTGRTSWFAGLANRGEMRFSRTSVPALQAGNGSGGSSKLSSVLFGYRVGPTVGLTYRASANVGLVLDSELSFSFSQPIRPHLGLVGGAIFSF